MLPPFLGSAIRDQRTQREHYGRREQTAFRFLLTVPFLQEGSARSQWLVQPVVSLAGGLADLQRQLCPILAKLYGGGTSTGSPAGTLNASAGRGACLSGSALAGNLGRRPVRRIDSLVRIGHPRGVGAGEMNPSQRCSAHLRLALGRRRVIVERVRVIGVAMPPAADGDRGDIPICLGAARTKDPRELVARLRLEFLETERIGKGATGAPGAAQVLDRASGPRYVDQVEDHRLLGARRAAVIADAHRVVKFEVTVEPSRV